MRQWNNKRSLNSWINCKAQRWKRYLVKVAQRLKIVLWILDLKSIYLKYRINYFYWDKFKHKTPWAFGLNWETEFWKWSKIKEISWDWWGKLRTEESDLVKRSWVKIARSSLQKFLRKMYEVRARSWIKIKGV